MSLIDFFFAVNPLIKGEVQRRFLLIYGRLFDVITGRMIEANETDDQYSKRE